MQKQLIDLEDYPVKWVLNLLLKDKTTKRNIIFATDSYSDKGEDYSFTRQMTTTNLLGLRKMDIQPRILKSQEEQQSRTRKNAEVFTPAWLCNQMNNYLDEEWFGRKDVFNIEKEQDWETVEDKIIFPEDKTWRDYIYSTRLEITCGEAPFLVSRYDTSTGELIIPPKRRIGLLDRKLRVVNENIESENEWIEWAIKAYQSCYGYEYQGDSLLIARINFLLTFYDYYKERWVRDPSNPLLRKIANIICWNLWQMDGLQGKVPYYAVEDEIEQTSLFALPPTEGMLENKEDIRQEANLPCRIFDWRSKESIEFQLLRKGNINEKV